MIPVTSPVRPLIMKEKRAKAAAPSEEERFACVDPGERVLLLSHCLRSSANCKATMSPDGLQCVSCNPTCQVRLLREKALELGYKGICVAPGGSLALRYVKERRPAGIVAVACSRELGEGIDAVREIADEHGISAPPITVVPLTRDGCVDTEVDLAQAIARISLGCVAASAK